MPLESAEMGRASRRPARRYPWSVVAWVFLGFLLGGVTFYLMSERVAGAGVGRALGGISRLEPWGSRLPPGSAVVFRGRAIATLDSRAAVPLSRHQSDSLIVFLGDWLGSQQARSARLDTTLVAYAPDTAATPMEIGLDSLIPPPPSRARLGELWLRPMLRPIPVFGPNPN
jgi:hypothetical protein